MASNYDNTAWFYDPLSRMVFGRSLIKSQTSLLKYIPAKANILIVGGGTGWLLDEITKVHPDGLDVTYVEISAKMMALSKNRNLGNNNVTFINRAIEDVKFLRQFDVIFTPFLFDNFTAENLHRIFNHIHNLLKPDGIWLNTDFQVAGKWWHKLILQTMYTFFKVFGAVETSTMPEIQTLFKQKNYRILSQQTYYGSFVISQAMQKQPA
ncbi:class I SAM-dependent methyltransferase [Mucilaginibacter agri]|uniref:Methyltransferase domain-containing protein n=1 Tax=Mucilaginibacter agri TaxID=2695265 RepID=A0A965ZJ39_9SPHI|nr:class I SAM-dependent methyltransferase [Mucilaginibacter agri]NCD71585.1 methyltransferase domain-containing protein [Mucilaginibacter agri]